MYENKTQVADQTFKGSVIALLTYLAYRWGWDEGLIAAAIPVVSGALAWLSGKFGAKQYNSFFTK